MVRMHNIDVGEIYEGGVLVEEYWLRNT